MLSTSPVSSTATLPQEFRDLVITPGDGHLVCYGRDADKDALFIHSVKTGTLLHMIPVK